MDKTKVSLIKGIYVVDAYFNESIFSCSACNSTSIVKNGHKIRTVKDCNNNLFLCKITCHMQRYKCNNCGNVFYENINLSPKHESVSLPSIVQILERLKQPENTFASVGEDFHLSRQDVRNIFNKYISYTPPKKLPLILSFDEKHINKSLTDHAYIFIIVDFMKKNIYNILPSRHKNKIASYFRSLPLEERKKVKYITIDMYETYRDLSSIYFPNAKIAVDSFHVVRNINDAMNRIRISTMNAHNNDSDEIENNTDYYYMLKKFRYYLFTDIEDIKSDIIYIHKFHYHMSKENILSYLLGIDEYLKKAYYLTKLYRDFNRTACYSRESEMELDNIISEYYSSNLAPFVKCAKMISTWKEYILNSLINVYDENNEPRRLSNGPCESTNSKLEKININGNGYTSFSTFAKRCIHVVNKDLPIVNPKNKDN